MPSFGRLLIAALIGETVNSHAGRYYKIIFPICLFHWPLVGARGEGCVDEQTLPYRACNTNVQFGKLNCRSLLLHQIHKAHTDRRNVQGFKTARV